MTDLCARNVNIQDPAQPKFVLAKPPQLLRKYEYDTIKETNIITQPSAGVQKHGCIIQQDIRGLGVFSNLSTWFQQQLELLETNKSP